MLNFLRRLPQTAIDRLQRAWQTYGIFWLGAVAVGLVAVGYAKLINLGFDGFEAIYKRWPYAPLLLTPACGVVAVYLTRYFFAGAEGSGIPQVVAALQTNDSALHQRWLALRTVPGKILGSLVAICGGFTIGREGPTVHVGAALMYSLRRFYSHMTPQMERQFILAGAAAGLSAAFNTPLAGVVFAIEELSRGFEERTSGTLITAILFAGAVALALAGNYNYFGQIHVASGFSWQYLVAIAVVGILTGWSGALFSWILLNTSRWMPVWLQHARQHRPLYFAAGAGLLIAGIGIASHGETWGSGYGAARAMLADGEKVGGFYAALKMATMVLSYLPGFPGGFFAPSLAIGAGFGQMLGTLFPSLPLSALIALAMVGYLAAVTQSPITAFVIVMEMIDGHGMVISLMATAWLASKVASVFTQPLYKALAENFLAAARPAQ